MGRKCSVYKCRTGYDGSTMTVYKFPDDLEERQEWASSMPIKFEKITKYMGVCALHWPSDTPLRHNRKGARYPTPTVPPSIFPIVPDSWEPTDSSCKPSPTSKSLSSAWNPAYDEMSEFRRNDRLMEDTFFDEFKFRFASLGLLSVHQNSIVLLSFARTDCIHEFSCYFSTECDGGDFLVSYELYFGLKRIRHPSLNNFVRHWFQLEEVLRFIQHYTEQDEDHRLNFIHHALEVYNCPKNSRVYSEDALSRYYSWFSMSRSLYLALRKYLCLPSESTLRQSNPHVDKTKRDQEESNAANKWRKLSNPNLSSCTFVVNL